MSNQPVSTSTWKAQKVTASDGHANEWFGSGVAVSGDTAFISAKNATVGNRGSQGAVYVFKKSGNAWKQAQRLVSSDGAAGDWFGSALALSGNFAIIAAPNATINGNVWQGAAYLFAYVGGKWVEKRKIVAKHGYAFETFGDSIGFNSTSVFIGAGGAGHAGQYIPRRVYVFDRGASSGGNAWTEKQILESLAPDDPTSSFGAALAVSEDVALVGARASLINGSIGQGAVFVYTRSKSGGWAPTAELTVGDGGPRDNFGTAVALLGNTALVGSPGATINGNISQGAVYRFERSGDDWHLVQKFVAADGEGSSLFGASISASNGKIVVGGYAAHSYEGSAYIFQNVSGTWAQSQKLIAPDATAGTVFGYYTALDGSTALVSAYTSIVNGNQSQGAAYFFTESAPPAVAKKPSAVVAKKPAVVKKQAAAIKKKPAVVKKTRRA